MTKVPEKNFGMPIDDLYSLAKSIAEEREKIRQDEYIGSGKLKPSSFGRCYRNQIFAMIPKPKTNYMDFKGLCTVTAGTKAHEFYQDILKDHYSMEQPLETRYFKAYVDMEPKTNFYGILWDIKTVSDIAFKRFLPPVNTMPIGAEAEKVVQAKLENWLQVGWYAVKKEYPRVGLFFVNRNGWEITQQYVVNTEVVAPHVEKEVTKLKQLKDEYHKNGSIPSGQPRAFGDAGKKKWECNACKKYCSWLELCKEMDDKKEDDLFKTQTRGSK